MKRSIYSIACILLLASSLLSSCGSSTTNVWDYYVVNEVIKHKEGETAVSQKKLLHRQKESPSKAQLEMIVVKQDDKAYLVLGSHKIAKSFYINDSLYTFSVTDIYSRVRGNDFIRQMGDLSIYFTHVPATKVVDFLNGLDNIKKQYADMQVPKGATGQVDFYLSHNVYVSMEKKQAGQTPSKCILHVGKRRHYISLKELTGIFNQVKAFTGEKPTTLP
jgi:hypothetical protein